MFKAFTAYSDQPGINIFCFYGIFCLYHSDDRNKKRWGLWQCVFTSLRNQLFSKTLTFSDRIWNREWQAGILRKLRVAISVFCDVTNSLETRPASLISCSSSKLQPIRRWYLKMASLFTQRSKMKPRLIFCLDQSKL